ncbi:MAG TPA: hypothetical protein VHY08_25760 [Bacillota bacterium]|nr:hypothetical protein [Bacillota bacterium]
MKTDQPIMAILLGLIPGPFVEGYTMLLKYFGLTNLTGAESLSLIWSSPPHLSWGIPTAFVQFTWINLVIYYSVRFWEADFFPVKALLLAMTGETLTFSIFGVLAGNQQIVQNVSGNYVHASAMGGAITGFLYQKFLYKYTQPSSLRTDKPLQAILIGYAGWPLMEGLTWLAKHFGLTNLSVMEAISLMWVSEPSRVLGVLAVLGLGAWTGLWIYYSANLWGKEYFPLKAAVILLICEALLFQIFGVMGGNRLLLQNSVGNLVYALAALAGGSLIGFLYQRLLFHEVPDKRH